MCTNKGRLVFAKPHANEMWQADTLYGPHVSVNGTPVQTRLIAFIDDASRVCCHGQFFPAENVDTLIEAIRAAFYKRGVPRSLYVGQWLDLLVQRDPSNLRPRRLPAPSHTRTTWSGEGKNRKIFPHGQGSVPLLQSLSLTINQELPSPFTYSFVLPPLVP